MSVQVLTRYVEGFWLNSRFPVNALCRVEKKGVKGEGWVKGGEGSWVERTEECRSCQNV